MNRIVYFALIISAMPGCTGTDVVDDMVPEKIEITNPIMSLKIGDSYELMYRYLNTVGMEEAAEVSWSSSNEDVIQVGQDGAVTALKAGQSEITIMLLESNTVMDKLLVEAAEETVVISTGMKRGTISTTSSYELTGDFEMINTETGVKISIADNYVADDGLPGLYVYLTNNPSTVSGALEIGAVSVFSGSHTYEVEATDLTVETYAYLLYFCKPFNVKVGDGEIIE